MDKDDQDYVDSLQDQLDAANARLRILEGSLLAARSLAADLVGHRDQLERENRELSITLLLLLKDHYDVADDGAASDSQPIREGSALKYGDLRHAREMVDVA
jgi:hypothetical protein